MQVRENRKLLGAAVSRGCAKLKINFIFVVVDGIRENRSEPPRDRCMRVPVSEGVIYEILNYSGTRKNGNISLLRAIRAG